MVLLSIPLNKLLWPHEDYVGNEEDYIEEDREIEG